MNKNPRPKSPIGNLVYQLLISAVVGGLTALVCWGIFHVHSPGVAQFSALIGICAFALMTAWFDLNGPIQ